MEYNPKADLVIYTGAVDELFSFKFGELDYRSLAFELEIHDQEYYQPVTTVNYPGEEPYTRVTEFKRIGKRKSKKTVVVREFPHQFQRGVEGKDIPYYPLFNEENEMRYLRYAAYARQFNNLFLVGRLAKFKYFNMDEAVHSALVTSSKILLQAAP